MDNIKTNAFYKEQRMKNHLIILMTVFCVGSYHSSIFADYITLVSDDWCPINCEPNSDQPGFMIEIAKLIFGEEGHTVEYKKLPWERAIIETRKGKNNAIIGAYKGDAPDFVFPENEQALIGNSLFVKADSTWTYNGISSLIEINIGVIKGYDYGEVLNNHIEKSKNTMKVQMVFGETALEKNIKKLLKGRIDAVLESEFVFNYKASQMGHKGRVKSAGQVVDPDKAYLAFSPANPKSKNYARILSDGMEKIRKSGELKKILARYDLEDWK